MLNWIYTALGEAWGPLRLFNSFFFLSGMGFAACALATFVLLPRLWSLLPTDRGRAFAINADQSVGKPVSAGLIFVSIFCVASLIFVPISARALLTVPFMLAALVVGYLDDRRGGFSEYQLAVMDAAIALGAATVICGFQPVDIWLPLWKGALTLPAWVAIPLAAGVIWLSINATNCSDGVDGVSGSLSGVAIIILGGLLYAQSFSLPHRVTGKAFVAAENLAIGRNEQTWRNGPWRPVLQKPAIVVIGNEANFLTFRFIGN